MNRAIHLKLGGVSEFDLHKCEKSISNEAKEINEFSITKIRTPICTVIEESPIVESSV